MARNERERKPNIIVGAFRAEAAEAGRKKHAHLKSQHAVLQHFAIPRSSIVWSILRIAVAHTCTHTHACIVIPTFGQMARIYWMFPSANRWPVLEWTCTGPCYINISLTCSFTLRLSFCFAIQSAFVHYVNASAWFGCMLYALTFAWHRHAMAGTLNVRCIRGTADRDHLVGQTVWPRRLSIDGLSAHSRRLQFVRLRANAMGECELIEWIGYRLPFFKWITHNNRDEQMKWTGGFFVVAINIRALFYAWIGPARIPTIKMKKIGQKCYTNKRNKYSNHLQSMRH